MVGVGHRATAGGEASGEAGLGRWFGLLALAAAALIVVQAAMAGQWWFGENAGIIRVHGYVGNVTFLVALGLAAVAVVGLRRGALGRGDVALSLVLLALATAQIGLGYMGRESAGAAAWHVPNGVLLTALTGVLIGRGLRRG